MCEDLIICAAEQIGRPFPLTPTLSPRERVKHLQSFVQLSTRFSAARPVILPFHEPPFANGLATILPLPFPRGEGRGEGSFSVERSRVQCANLSGNSLPEGEGGVRGKGRRLFSLVLIRSPLHAWRGAGERLMARPRQS